MLRRVWGRAHRREIISSSESVFAPAPHTNRMSKASDVKARPMGCEALKQKVLFQRRPYTTGQRMLSEHRRLQLGYHPDQVGWDFCQP